MSSIGNGHFVRRTMNAIADIATAQKLARTVEDAEARRLGLPLGDARNRVAGRLGVAPGTLENIRRMRAKVIPSWLMARIRAEFITVLQREILHLENEIHIARQIGMDHREDDFSAAETQLHEAKKILNGTA